MPEWYSLNVPCRDVQLDTPLGACIRCGGELYGAEAEPDVWGRTYCPVCKEDIP